MKMPWKFVRCFPIAQRILSRGRLPAVLIAVARKRSANGGLLKGLQDDLALLQGLCVAWWKGEYRAVSKSTLVAVVAGLLYFLSPIDAVPDWIPFIGFLDDLALLGWVMKKCSDELDAFRAWRDSQSQEVWAEIGRLPGREEPMADVSDVRVL